MYYQILKEILSVPFSTLDLLKGLGLSLFQKLV